ncbi:MAG: hypothetical protein Kow00124_09070 [Anaerolineae bacterium]
MKHETGIGCQMLCYARIAEERVAPPPESLTRKVKLFIRRNVSPARERALRASTNKLMNRLARLRGKPPRPTAPPEALAATNLQAGDLVRVRSKEEIEATLDNWGQLKGCGFMPEMEQFCGTTQRVLKRVERFVDERDLRVKRAKGLIFLDGVFCTGTADFGPCDRTCYFFWREEWLEKIGGPPGE